MKISQFKSLTLKGMFTKVLTAGVLAGAVFMAAPQKAEAQRFAVGVQFGHPAYYGPAYAPAYGPGFYAERRHEEFYRHDRWDRDHRFHRGYYR